MTLLVKKKTPVERLVTRRWSGGWACAARSADWKTLIGSSICHSSSAVCTEVRPGSGGTSHRAAGRGRPTGNAPRTAPRAAASMVSPPTFDRWIPLLSVDGGSDAESPTLDGSRRRHRQNVDDVQGKAATRGGDLVQHGRRADTLLGGPQTFPVSGSASALSPRKPGRSRAGWSPL